MIGAREYEDFFTGSEIIGKLKIVMGSHARGSTLHVYVISGNDEVEVYGVVGGNPGWTESYGWLHKGPWQKDFYDIVERRKREIEERIERHHRESQIREENEKKKTLNILSNY